MTAAVDLYPTRRQDQPRWHERIDPISYRRHDREAPLTAQQIDQFERDGFLLLPNAFSAVPRLPGRLILVLCGLG